MSHESRKADQAGQADAGISSGADSSRRRPSGEEAGDESTPEARTSPDGIEAFRGYRLWRLVAGQLRSHRNDTVWPRGRALAARARLGTAYWREKINSLGVSVALSMITATMGAAVLGILYDSAVALLGGPLPLSRGIAALSVGVSLFVIPVVVHLRRSPLSPVVKARLMGLVVVAGSNTPGIYAMRWQSDVQDWDDQSAPGQALVRGTVWLWGDTIEHEYGVKGEFAYPGAITDVRCFGCHGWVPIEEYSDESEPPLDARCRAGGFSVPEWKPAGLSQLRASAPQWFEGALPEGHSPAGTRGA